jgi:hypothetical protein
MSRRGRAPWSSRVVVEDCLAFDIAKLVRAGVFRAKPGTLCSTAWKNPHEQEIFRAYFCVELTANGRTLLHVSSGVPSNRSLIHYPSQTIEIAQTQLYFGPRHWFLCPGVRNNSPCLTRARILYFPPNTNRLGCRKCHNLIHRSAREHNARINGILRLPIEKFRETLYNDAIRLGLLTFRVGRVLQRRLEKKAAKFNLLAAK